MKIEYEMVTQCKVTCLVLIYTDDIRILKILGCFVK